MKKSCLSVNGLNAFHYLDVVAALRRAPYFSIWIFELEAPEFEFQWFYLPQAVLFNLYMHVSHLEILLKCRFLFRHLGLGLRFQQVPIYVQQSPRWCCSCYFMDHTCSSKHLGLPVSVSPPISWEQCQSHRVVAGVMWVVLTKVSGIVPWLIIMHCKVGVVVTLRYE